MVWLLIVAGVIIAGLAGYAAYLWWLVRQKQLAQQHAAQLQQEEDLRQLAARNENLWQSVETIAWATQQGQCCFSEASIRLCVLLNQLHFSEEPHLEQRFPALHGLYKAIAHHPTHEARKQYAKQEIRKLDKERLHQEQQFAKAIEVELQQLLDWRHDLKQQEPAV